MVCWCGDNIWEYWDMNQFWWQDISFKRTYQYFIAKKYQKENINIFIIVCWREDNGARRKSEHLWPSLSVDTDGAWQTICKSQNQKYAKSQKKYARTQNHICEGLSRCCRKKSPFCHQKSDAEKIRKVVFESAPKRFSKFEWFQQLCCMKSHCMP